MHPIFFNLLKKIEPGTRSGKVAFLGVLFVLQACQYQEHQRPLEVTFTGDMMLARSMENVLRPENQVAASNQVNQLLHGDFTVANFEGVLADSLQSADSFTGGFNLSVKPELLDFIEQTSISHLSHANNHSLDAGITALQETVEAIAETEIESIGYEKSPTILTKGSYRMALFSGTCFADTTLPWYASAYQLAQAMLEHRASHPHDFMVAYLHWGQEYWPSPSNEQRTVAKRLFASGCDAIVGHHPHVVQSIEFVGKKPVFYSLGNFMADPFAPQAGKGLILGILQTTKDTLYQITGIDLLQFVPTKMSNIDMEVLLVQLSQYSQGVILVQKQEEWYALPEQNIRVDSTVQAIVMSSGSDTYFLQKRDEQISKLTYYSGSKLMNRSLLEGRIEGMELGDVLNNGRAELLLMVRKKVHFDQQDELRINVYGPVAGSMKAIWLGTRMAYYLQTYHCTVSDGKTYLRTSELNTSGEAIRCTYLWNEFGFELITAENKTDEKS